ncbi:extracellular catalytic domain type 1 short-chain-length polyhydroxyalkanoate depolymerase [Thiobaca trueperi]|uniref:Poly(Hydroxyalkanoate) depolymerase family esterase n=1 Tax=Thiobaca trueperi TaxID=127458 RepID=A0A4R3MUZ0_9GAMM|nr:PHB depolymerase family esterase [Thiobaca trueperi]TCT19161.1 poly(hydroxyalkanoate) depolymerase family esterase [Thiobaca trueperi]
MMMNETMLAGMRAAMSRLQTEGPGAATETIQQRLRGRMPAGTWPGNAATAYRVRATDPPPFGTAVNPGGVVNGFVPDLLARLGIDAPLNGLRFERPVFAPPVDAQADGDAPAPGQFLAGSFTNPAGTRAYKLYVPTAYQGQPLPLVVMLHGCMQNPDDFAVGTRLNAIAEEQSCLVLYPAQSQSANGSKCWNWFNTVDQQRGQGEASLIAGMTQEVVTTYHIDPSRVYIAGLSAGGAMALIMGTTYPELYAAVGIHSGVPYAAANDLPSALAAMKGTATLDANARQQAVPIIVFHGDRDTTVHPRNSDLIMSQSVASPARAQTKTGLADDGHHAYTQRVHEDSDGRIVAEHWLVHGAGHAWSGGSQRGSFTDGKGPDASQEMMRFFAMHSKPASRVS